MQTVKFDTPLYALDQKIWSMQKSLATNMKDLTEDPICEVMSKRHEYKIEELEIEERRYQKILDNLNEYLKAQKDIHDALLDIETSNAIISSSATLKEKAVARATIATNKTLITGLANEAKRRFTDNTRIKPVGYGGYGSHNDAPPELSRSNAGTLASAINIANIQGVKKTNRI